MESSRSLTKGLIKSGKPRFPMYLPTEAYIRVNLVRGAHGWLISYAKFSQPIVPINTHNILRNAIPWCYTWISALYLNRSKVLPPGCINSFLLSAMHLKRNKTYWIKFNDIINSSLQTMLRLNSLVHFKPLPLASDGSLVCNPAASPFGI